MEIGTKKDETPGRTKPRVHDWRKVADPCPTAFGRHDKELDALVFKVLDEEHE